MVQTGVPFGEISAISAPWMQIEGTIGKPRRETSQNVPVEGFCLPTLGSQRQNGCGVLFCRTLWLRRKLFPPTTLSSNYCPLAFFDKDGRNLTPDKLAPPGKRHRCLLPATGICVARLKSWRPEWLIGIGDFR